jgi:hypothetical protein
MEAIANQLQNLEETITDLLALAKSLPEGEIRDKFLDEIGSLDSIADAIRQALDMGVSD